MRRHGKRKADDVWVQERQAGLDTMCHGAPIDKGQQIRETPSLEVGYAHRAIIGRQRWCRFLHVRRRDEHIGHAIGAAQSGQISMPVLGQSPWIADLTRETPSPRDRTRAGMTHCVDKVTREKLVIATEDLVRSLAIEQNDDALIASGLHDLPLAEETG